MLKKTVLFAFLLSSSSLSFAKNVDSTLTVAPNDPSGWAYMGATVSINDTAIGIYDGVTVPVALNDHISLAVYAMNVKPKLDDSCQNIQIREEGKHQLLFELRGDWLIHCRYS